ncbi:MAG: hypothetical protein WC058_07650 [Phycisphaeraceae bacterium]
MKRWILLIAACCIAACGLAIPLFAEDAATPPDSTSGGKPGQSESSIPGASAAPGSATTPAPADPSGGTADTSGGGGQPTAEQVLNELLRKRAENPLIEPARPAEDTDARQSNANAASLGTAPNLAPGKLKREGSFILARRGRMVRAPGGATPWMFTFDADADGLQDPPMFLMPCQLLEDMEQVVEDHADRTSFLISGQVFVYHGANYLMPTLMKIAPDRGNLQP